MINAGADVNAKTHSGKTALFISTIKEYGNICIRLLKAGATMWILYIIIYYYY